MFFQMYLKTLNYLYLKADFNTNYMYSQLLPNIFCSITYTFVNYPIPSKLHFNISCISMKNISFLNLTNKMNNYQKY